MFCSKCGTKIEDGDSFCTNCGEPKISVNKTEIIPQPQADVVDSPPTGLKKYPIFGLIIVIIGCLITYRTFKIKKFLLSK